MADYKTARALGKIERFAKAYSAPQHRIDQSIVGTLFGGDTDPLEAFIDDVHYQRRPGEEAHTFIDRVYNDVMKRAEVNEMSLEEVADFAWQNATSVEIGGITLVREPDESAEFFKARVEAFMERMDGGLH